MHEMCHEKLLAHKATWHVKNCLGLYGLHRPWTVVLAQRQTKISSRIHCFGPSPAQGSQCQIQTEGSARAAASGVSEERPQPHWSWKRAPAAGEHKEQPVAVCHSTPETGPSVGNLGQKSEVWEHTEIQWPLLCLATQICCFLKGAEWIHWQWTYTHTHTTPS